MRLAAIIGIAALTALAACDDTGDYPTLLPTDAVLAQPALPRHAGDAAASPAAATEALSARAAALAGHGGTGQVADQADLDRRAADLRARAKALSQRSLDACPEDQPDCAAETPGD